MEQLMGNPLAGGGGYNVLPELELMLLFKAKILKRSMDKFIFNYAKVYNPNTNENILSTAINKIKDKYYENKFNNYSQKYNYYANIYSNFRNELITKGITDFSNSRIIYLCELIFQDDISYRKRISFVINYILNMNDTQYEKDVFNELNVEYSNYLKLPFNYGISTITSSLKKNWLNITGNKSFNKKLALAVFGFSLIASLIAGPAGIGAVAGASHATLAALGGSVVGGMAVANSLALLGSATLGVFVYVTKNFVDKHILSKEFKKLTDDEMSYVLALNITVLEYIKKLYTNNCSDYKETISFLIDTNNDMLNDYFINLNYQNNYKEKINLMLKSFDIINNKI